MNLQAWLQKLSAMTKKNSAAPANILPRNNPTRNILPRNNLPKNLLLTDVLLRIIPPPNICKIYST